MNDRGRPLPLRCLGSREHDGTGCIRGALAHCGRQHPSGVALADARRGEVLAQHEAAVVQDRAPVEQVEQRLSASYCLPLPDEVVDKTRSKYVEAYERLTGETFR